MTTYLLDHAHAARIAAHLLGREHPGAQAAGRALARALARRRGDILDVTLPDEHWPWIIGAAA